MDIPIGFIQGRLSPLVDCRIQAFPLNHWRQEFPIARKYGFKIMEWTLDQDRLYENPLMIERGRSEIINLISKHNVSIPSLTGDCFMQAPIWKLKNGDNVELTNEFLSVLKSCNRLKVKIIVVPCVDSSSIITEQ